MSGKTPGFVRSVVQNLLRVTLDNSSRDLDFWTLFFLSGFCPYVIQNLRVRYPGFSKILKFLVVFPLLAALCAYLPDTVLAQQSSAGWIISGGKNAEMSPKYFGPVVEQRWGQARRLSQGPKFVFKNLKKTRKWNFIKFPKEFKFGIGRPESRKMIFFENEFFWSK